MSDAEIWEINGMMLTNFFLMHDLSNVSDEIIDSFVTQAQKMINDGGGDGICGLLTVERFLDLYKMQDDKSLLHDDKK